MAILVEDIAREIVESLALQNQFPNACQWIDRRYRELAGKVKFRHARKYGQMYLPAAFGGFLPAGGANGTVTITQNSTVIIPDATSAANIIAYNTAITSPAYSLPTGPQAFVGQFFRAQQSRVWYRIVEVAANGTSITLETPFADDNGALFQSGPTSAGNAYYIVPRYMRAPDDARSFGVFVADYMYAPLAFLSQDEMAVLYPSRFLVAAYPWAVSVLGEDVDETGQPTLLEIYPWPTTSVTIHFTYWEHPRRLGQKTPVPKVIDADILREGAMVDAMRKKAAIAADKGIVDIAGYWRNEYRMQETKWEGLQQRAARNDRGVDDIAFIVQRTGGWRRGRVYDTDVVQTAYQNFLARGY